MAPLSGALLAARRGWPVFPVGGPNGPKAPRPGWSWPTRNTTDSATVRRWLAEATAYGIACGPARLVVIDLDVAKDGSGESGQAALAALCEAHGESWPVTYIVATPSGGLHLYFRARPDRKITNSRGSLPPRIDVRGVGGFVVGAGSVIPAGDYRVAGSVLALAPLPGWLAALIAERPTPGTQQAARAVPVSDAYAQAALDAEAALVAAAPEGCRNHQLFSSAYALARFPDRELSAAAIMLALRDAAYQAGLAEPEVSRTIRSALRTRRG